MSRAVNISATLSSVTAACKRLGLAISSIEELLPAGTRVVLVNPAAAEAIRGYYGARVFTGAVERVPLRTGRG